MHAIFFGHGPAFKRDVVGKPFQNVEINYLMQGDALNFELLDKFRKDTLLPSHTRLAVGFY